MDEKIIVGDIVVSILGHDKGLPFLVVDIDKSNKIVIIDGRYRKIENPKVKNPKHLKKVGHEDIILQKYHSPLTTNAEIYKLIKIYKEIKE